MHLVRRLVLSLCLVATAATSWAGSSPADANIADGRAALVAHDLATARAQFTLARAADPANETAAALLGITQWFAIVGDSGTQTFLDGLGIPSNAGRDLYNWTAEFPKNTSGQQVLPNAYSSQTALGFINNTLVPQAATVRGNLAAVTSDNFLLTLSAQETAGVSITADRGDLLIAQAGLRMFEFFSHFLAGQDLNVDASVALELARGNLISLPQMLRDNPNLLTVGSASERTAARTALLDAIALYRQGSAFIRARPAGVERMFMLDAQGAADEADLRAKLSKIEESLNGYVSVGGDGGQFATLAPLFTAGYSFRANLPDPSQPFDVQTFSGATFGGLLSTNSRESAAADLVKLGFIADFGWTNISPAPVPENISKYLFTGTTHVLLGNGGVIGRSAAADGVAFTYTTIPEAQDFFSGAVGNGVIVAGAQSELWLSADDGLTWKKVFKTFTGVDSGGIGAVADVAFDGAKFVAVSQGGFTWQSTDGAHWTDGQRVRYGSAFPTIRAMEFGGGRFTAVGSVFVPNGTGSVQRSAVFSSTNGKDWVQSFVGSTSAQYRSVAFGAGKWIVGGAGGRFARSLDGGIAWSESFSGDATETLFAAGFGGSTFVLAGSNGRVGTSADAITWSFQSVADNPTFFDAAGNGSFVYLVGSAGAVYRSAGSEVSRLDNNTTLLPSRSLAFEEPVVFNGKLFVGGSDGAVYESADGFTGYTRHATTTANSLFALTVHNGNLLVAVGVGGTIVTSPTGADSSWTTQTSGTAQLLLKVASLNGQLVAVGAAGTLLTSPDGITWTKRTTNTTALLRCVAFGNGRFVVGSDPLFNSSNGQFETALLTSTDGVAWTRSVIRSNFSSTSTPSVRAILPRAGHFLLFLTDGSVVQSSFNNGGFSSFEVAGGLGAQSAAFEHAGVLYSLSPRANDETHSTLNYSLDETTWVRTELPTSVGFFGSTVFNGQIFTFGNFGRIMRSSVLVAQPRSPVAFSGGTQTVGLGGNIGLGVPVDASEELDFQWSFNGQAIAGANQAVLTLNNVQAGQAGAYTLVATGRQTGVTATNTVTLDAVAAAPFITRQPANTVVAPGETAVLSVEATGAGTLTFAWFKNGTLLPSATSSVLTLPNVSQSDAAVYHATVTNATGTTTSLEATVSLAANLAGFWRTVPDGSLATFGPSRTIHDGLGHIYTTTLNGPLDIVANQAKGLLVRLDEATGVVDPTFQWDDRFGTPSFVAVQPDGQLLVAVTAGFFEGSTVIRVSPSGVRDSSFTAPFFDRSIRFITLQSDGKVLVAATDNLGNSAPAGAIVTANPTIFRLGSDGTLDASNVFMPVVLTAANSGNLFLTAPPVVDGSGRIYLTGAFTQISSNGVTFARTNLARVDSAGVVDTAFGDPAVPAQLPAGFASSQARGAAIQSDGKVVFVGDFRYTGRGTGSYVFNGLTFGDRIMAIRFNADGTFDTTYGQPLRSQLPMNPNFGFRIRFAVMQPDNSVVAVSDSVFRLTAGGSFDGTFQSQSFNHETFWVSRASNGNIYVSDLPENTAPGNIAAFTSSGLRINTFNSGGWGGTASPGTAFALADGRVMAGGSFNHFGATNVNGAALFNAAGGFVSDSTPFYHPTAGRTDPLTQVTGWSDGSFAVRESAFGNPQNGSGASVTTRRYNADGSDNPQWNFPDSSPNGAEVITATEPGKLLVWVGAPSDTTLVSSGTSTWMRRFNADGSQDPTFTPDLSALVGISRNGSGVITDVSVGRLMQVRALPDGSMLLAIITGSTVSTDNGKVRVLHMLPNGQIDSSYTTGNLFAANSNGTVTASAFDPQTGTTPTYNLTTFFSAAFNDILALPDGRAYLTGSFQIAGQPFGIARLLANGAADTGFAGAGLLYTNAQQPVPAAGIALGLDDSGRVYLTGRFDNINGTAAAGLARFTAAGVLDTAFAPGLEVRSDRLNNSMVVGKAGRLHVLGAAALPGAPFTAGYESVAIDSTAPVIIGQSATTQSLTAGQSLQLFAGAFGGADGTGQWSFNGGNIAGATSPVLSIPNVTSANAGAYIFTVTNSQGTANTNTIGVTVSDAPVIVSQPQGGSVNTGGSITLSVGAFGAAPVTYQWFKNSDFTLSGATGPSFTITNAQAGDAASYTVVVTANGSSITSAAAVVTVDAAPAGPTITLQPVSQNVVSGYTTVLSVAPSGSGNTVQWFMNGVAQSANINNNVSTVLADGTTVTASTLTVTNSTITAPTAFVATITGSNGAVSNSNVATLTPEAGYSLFTLAGSATTGTNDGTGTGARFRFPQGAVADSSGNLFVADTSNHTIRKITTDGVVTTFAGLAQSSGSTDATGTAARFNNPIALAIDGSNNLYVADQSNNKIRKIDSAGVVTTLAGSGTNGSADGTGTGAQFSSPRAITFASDGNLYVADGGHTIRRVTLGGVVSTFAGAFGATGSTDATGTGARFNSPQGIAADASGNLFVADTNNHTVRQIVISTGVVSTLAGTAGSSNVTNGTGSAARFTNPRGIAVSGTNIFVTDSAGQTVRQIATGAVVTTLTGLSFNSGSDNGSSTVTRFNFPTGLATDASGNLFVTDTTNNAIRKIVISSATTSTFAGVTPGSTDATGTGARFNFPQGIARDNSGNVYIADTTNCVIRKIDSAGVVTTFAGGTGINGFFDATGTAARFSFPTALAIDNATPQNLYVADSSHAIRKIDLSTAAVTTIAGGGTGFQFGFFDANGTNALFNSPGGLVFDATTSSLYVSDVFNHSIRRVFLAPDAFGHVANDVITVAGTNTSGAVNGTGANARFNQPRGIAVDASGNVFVADTNNAVIRKVVPGTGSNGGVVTTFAGSFSQFNTTDGAGTTARFNSPRGLVFDSTTGGFYEADSSGVVRRISSTGAVTSLAGTAFNNNNVDATGTGGRMNNPTHLVIDSSGILYIADTQNSTIRRAFSSSLLFITTQPASQTVATGGSVSFTVNATGSGLSFQWKLGGTNVTTTSALTVNSQANTSTLTINPLALTDAGNYTVTVSNSNGSITSGTAVLTVADQAANDNFANALPFFGLNGTNTTANLVATFESLSGEPTNFSNNATNSSLWYQWTPVVSGIATIDTFGSISGTSGTTGQDTAISVYTGTNLADLAFLASNNDAEGTTQSKVTIPVTAGTSYFIQAGTNNGSRGNIKLNFSVAVLPAPSADVVIAGQSPQFAITLDGTQSAFGAQWSLNGVDIGGATSPTFNIAAAAGSDSGVYLAGIAQSAGSPDYTFSQPAYLLVAGAGSTTQIDHFDGLAISANWLPNPLVFLPSTEAGFSVSDQLQFTTASAPFNPIDRALQSATNLPLDRDWSVVTRIGLGTQAQFSGITGSGVPRKAGLSLGVFSPNNSLDALNVGARIANDGSGTVVRQFFQDFDQGGTGSSAVSALGSTQTNTLVRLDYSAASGVVTSSVAGASGFTALSSADVISGWGLDRSQSLRLVLRAFSTRMAVTPGTVFADDFGLAISPAIITAQPTSRSLSIGASTTLSVTATGATAFQWFHNGVSLGAGAQTATLDLTNVTTGDAGAYTVQVTTATGSVTSAAANVAVNQFEIATQPTHQTVAAGAEASLAVTTSGTGTFTFQWFRNGVSLGATPASAQTATLTIPAASTTDQGYYTATVSDGTTTLTTRPALLALTDDPNVLRLASAQPSAEFKFANAPSRVYLDGRGGVLVTDFIQFFSANNVGGNRLDAVLRLDATTGAPDLNYARTPQLAYSMVAAPQPDGTVIVAGSTADDLDLPATRYRLFRYRTDGTLDPNYHGAFLSNLTRFITRLTDGRILLSAAFDTAPTSNEPTAVNISVINRFLPDGTRDTSFTAPTLNTGGFLTAEPRLDSQGRILIAGSFTSVSGHTTPNVARLLPNGAVDTSFVASGFTPDTVQGIRAAVPVAGDKVLIGGRRLAINGTRFVVARLNANGSLDSTFTLVQPTTFGFTTNSSNNNTRYIAPISGGRFYTLTDNQIIRFFDDGSVDPNFNRVVAPPGGFVGGHVFTQLTAQDDGSFYTTYDIPVTQGDTSRTGVIRVAADGTIDPAFNAPEFAHEVFPSIALAKSDGSLIVGGQSFNRVGTAAKGGLVRILANGTIDPSFSVTVPEGMDTFASGGLTSTGQIYAIATGTTRDQNLDQVFNSALVRYNADGTVDGGFTAPPADLTGASLSVQSDQAFVFRNTVEDLQSGQPLAARLNADGTVDNTFAVAVGAQGAFSVSSPFNAALAPFTPIAQLPGGGFLMVAANGPFTATQTTFDVTLKKLKLDGTFDSTFTGPVIAEVPTVTTSDFSVSGTTYTAAQVAYAPFTAATVLVNGNILVAGRTGSYGGVTAPAGVALLDATGAPDATFAANLGTGPQLLGTANSFARVDKFVALPSGKILVTGSFDTWNGKPVPGIARINADGTPDAAFFAGVSYYNYLPTTTDLVSAGGNAFWLLGQYRRGVDGWPFAVNRVEFPPAPDIGSNPTDQIVVVRGTATFAVSPTGIAPFTFQWKKGGVDISGATNSTATTSTLVISNAQFSDAGSYSVAITNANGTTVSNSATLTVVDGFEVFRAANFNSGELADSTKSGPNAIFGFDGLTNLVKYALGLPAKTDAVVGLPTLTNDGTDWIYTFTRPKTTTDLDYAVEVNTDLTNLAGWTTTGVSALEPVSSTTTTETLRVRFPAAGTPRLFVRLRVTQAASIQVH